MERRNWRACFIDEMEIALHAYICIYATDSKTSINYACIIILVYL